MDEVICHAQSLGLRVAYRDLGRRDGELHSSGLVILNPNRSMRTKRQVLAHECGHWHHGHDWTRDHDRPRDERQANIYAARLLVTPEAYVEPERTVGCHPGALADELGVTRKLIELWRADYLAEVGVVRRIPTRAAG